MRSADGLDYTIRGQGEPVVLIHGSHVADSFLPLVREAALADRYQLVRYHRRGLGRSAPHTGPFTIEQQARDALRLAQELGLRRFHAVGHSYGAVTAVQLALAAPGAVHSLVLLEPPLFTAAEAASRIEAFAPVVALYGAGDARGAVDAFMAAVGGPSWRGTIEAAVPGGPEQAERDAATFFEVEIPALAAWGFDGDKAKRIVQPALFLIGGESGPLFEGPKQLFTSLVPHTEAKVLSGLKHFLLIENPTLVARTIADFLARHPLG